MIPPGDGERFEVAVLPGRVGDGAGGWPAACGVAAVWLQVCSQSSKAVLGQDRLDAVDALLGLSNTT